MASSYKPGRRTRTGKSWIRPYFPMYKSVPMRDRYNVDGCNCKFHGNYMFGYTENAGVTTADLVYPLNFIYFPTAASSTIDQFNYLGNTSPTAGSFHKIAHGNTITAGWNERLQDFSAYAVYGVKVQLEFANVSDSAGEPGNVERWGITADLAYGSSSAQPVAGTAIQGAGSFFGALSGENTDTWYKLKQMKYTTTAPTGAGIASRPFTSIKHYLDVAKFYGFSREEFRGQIDRFKIPISVSGGFVVGATAFPVDPQLASTLAAAGHIVVQMVATARGDNTIPLLSRFFRVKLTYYTRLFARNDVRLYNNPSM